MRIFDGIKETKTQVYFRDNNRFKFIKRPLEYTCLTERRNGELYMAWKHNYANQLYFPGYKGISADTVTLGFARDIILDPFNKIPEGSKPNEKPSSGESITYWISKIATNQRHTIIRKRAPLKRILSTIV